MIGQFNPFPVTAAVLVGATWSTVNVRATTAATELSNIIEWLIQNDGD
jgi:hypothetical protein